jgi:hypothetical protein
MARYLLLICLLLPICANALPIQGNFVVDRDLIIEPGHYQLDSFVINQGATLSFLPDFDKETVVFEVRDDIKIFGSMILGGYSLELKGLGTLLAEGSRIEQDSSFIIITDTGYTITGGEITVRQSKNLVIKPIDIPLAIDQPSVITLQTVPAPSSILLTLLGLCTLFIARYWQPILKS